MAGTIGIISSAIIEKEQIISFIKNNGGFCTGDDSLFGRFSKENSHIWIGISPVEELWDDEESKKMFVEKLGDVPVTNIIVEIGEGVESKNLALNFALLFMSRWPAIVDNLEDHLFSRDDLMHFREIGKNFQGFNITSAPQSAK